MTKNSRTYLKALCRLACMLPAFLLWLSPRVYAGTVNKKSVKASGNSIAYYTVGTPTINTYSDVQTGTTVSQYLTLQTSLVGSLLNTGWHITVRANGDFVNGTATIPAQYMSLKFNTATSGPTGVTGSQVALSGTDATLLTGTTDNKKKIYYMAQNYDFSVQGGPQLLVPTTGTYSTTLTVSVYDATGTLLATSSSVVVSVQINFSNSCSGVALGASFSNQFNFSTYSQVQSGGTASQALTVQYTPNQANCTGWSLRVRANGNFTNGSSTITPDHVSLAFNSVTQGSPSASQIGVTNTPVQLSTSDVNLISSSNAPFVANTYTAQTYDMIIQGGNYLLLGTSGTYSCPITLSLYNANGQLVATANVTISFQISYSNSNSSSITMNTTSVALQYQTPSDYLNGVTVSNPNAMTVTGYSSYQVLAATLDANLSNGSSTIPVNIIHLTNSAPSGMTAITSTPINLSTTNQVIITNPVPDYTYQTVQYSLTYSIAGGNGILVSVPAGSYTTQLIFVVLPN